jgi:hypothetical protein
MDLRNGNRFMLMLSVYSLFQRKEFSVEGFSSKLAFSKALSNSDNPSATIRSFVDDLVSGGVLFFNHKGFLVIDKDLFRSAVESSESYDIMEQFVAEGRVLFW